MLLPFVDRCLFNHLVQLRFSRGAFCAAFVPDVRFLFHDRPHGINFDRNLFPLTLKNSNSSSYHANFVQHLHQQVAPDGILSCHTTLCYCHLSRLSVKAQNRPLVDGEDIKSSTESTISTSLIQCMASVGNCEQVHTSVLNLIFQQTKLAGEGNLSK